MPFEKKKGEWQGYTFHNHQAYAYATYFFIMIPWTIIVNERFHVNKYEGFVPWESSMTYQYQSPRKEEVCWYLKIGLNWVIMQPITPILP